MGITIALLQAALGGALLVVLFFVLVAVVVVMATVYGGALGSGEGKQEAAPIIPPGTILAASGLGMVVLGVLHSFSLLLVGIILGGLAYYRGARVLGLVVSVLAFVRIFAGYYLGSAHNPNQFSF